MYVGVILLVHVQLYQHLSVPHVCGGDPMLEELPYAAHKCSPCMWG